MVTVVLLCYKLQFYVCSLPVLLKDCATHSVLSTPYNRRAVFDIHTPLH